jgi:hypothetical protein
MEKVQEKYFVYYDKSIGILLLFRFVTILALDRLKNRSSYACHSFLEKDQIVSNVLMLSHLRFS